MSSDSSANTVVVRTVQTNFINSDEPVLSETYTRVIGVETARGLAVCAGLGEIALNATTQVLAFADADQADRFVQYFAGTIARSDTSNRDSRYDADYNCFSFAQVVAGGMRRLGWESAELWLKQHFLPQPATPPFALGQQGYLVLPGKTWQLPTIRHAVIGLGEDVDTCLSVLGIGGTVAIATYHALAEYYGVQLDAARGVVRKLAEYVTNTAKDLR